VDPATYRVLVAALEDAAVARTALESSMTIQEMAVTLGGEGE
jgi:hypothetical protein